MQKILVTGACGQLGTELRNLKGSSKHFIFTDIAESEGIEALDICNSEEVSRFISGRGISAIVNCAAYTNVDKAETDSERCLRINVDGPANLAKAAKACDAALIQISSDYVFDGRRVRGSYKETDPCHPLSVYGESKRKCEVALRRIGCRGVIIRTAWLYSPYGKNFVKTMQRLGAEKEEVRVVCDQFGSPTCALDLAKAILKILPQIGDRRCEIYQYTDEGVCNWAEFAKAIMELTGSSCNVVPVSTAEYGSSTDRPAYSVLDKSLIRDTFGVKTPWWFFSLKSTIKRNI
jgi:dTDP-4-dehydrorhamnose reductase